MPSYMKMGDVRALTYSELARWWEVDFDVLVTTAIAEATGPIHPSASEALHSDAWTERWADALYAGAGELASSVERMTYTCDTRLAKVRRQSGAVQERMGEVNALLKARQQDQGWEMLPEHLKDARLMALAILAKHYREEADQLFTEELGRQGLPTHPPLYGTGYRNVMDAIEDATKRGLIDTPASPGIHALLAAPPHKITHLAAGDVTDQQERVADLRHPLLLRPWASALEHLRDRHCELAGIPAQFTISLSTLNMRELRAESSEDAWDVINRRRFIRALAQRWRECQMLIRQLGRTVAQVSEDLRRPWYEASWAAREELGQRHAEQMHALVVAFAPYCEAETTRIRRGALPGRTRGPLVRELRQALADGCWRALLDPTAHPDATAE
ncbi:hypothetical protein [Streptacidiphilus rugosus]|uniref:hypothetical protein n=1 Tax=Streptacidiphilus rugosus TaxID=405783 RepID=UPI0012F924DD|nr:hypothetical protein [Streptacidiphilus rugosus]